jgi:hypothetical protein
MAAKSLVEQAWASAAAPPGAWNQRRTAQSACTVENPTNADIAINA